MFCGIYHSQSQNLDFLDAIHLGDGLSQNDEVEHIQVYPDGDILTSGRFRGLTDFDIDSNQFALLTQSANNGGVFIARYSPQGTLRWVKPITSPSGVTIRALEMDALGNIYITGSFQPTISFSPSDPSQTYVGAASNNANGYLAKLDTAGQLIWVRFFMGNSIDTGMKLKLNSLGQVIVLGHASQTVVFDSTASNATLITAGAGDIFVAAYTQSNGQFLWMKQFFGVGFDNARGLALDSQNNIYLMGDFTSTFNFPSTPLPTPVASSGGNDVFVAKLSATGAFMWGKKIAGTSTDLGADLQLSGDSLLLVSGSFRFNFNFDQGVPHLLYLVLVAMPIFFWRPTIVVAPINGMLLMEAHRLMKHISCFWTIRQGFGFAAI